MTPINGYWAKAWDGYLLHFWTDYHTTLCGKTHMTPHNERSWYMRATAICKKCKKKHNALLARQEREATQ